MSDEFMNTSFVLHPLQPFRLDYTVWALRRRSKNIVDRWTNKHYVRLFFLENQLIKITVRQENEKDLVVSTNKKINKQTKIKITRLLEMIFGLNCQLKDFYHFAKQDPHLDPLVMQFKGLKPPRFASIFEALVNAISCQQLSLDAGLEIQNRFVEYAGKNIRDLEGTFYAFPTPTEVANYSVSELNELGYSINKWKALLDLSARINKDGSLFDGLENQSNEEIIKFLCQFKGIGRWSAEYVLLRGFGKIEVFPGDDVGAKKNLKLLLHLKQNLDYQKIAKITQKWYPYAGLIYFHLLLDKLFNKGLGAVYNSHRQPH